MSGAAVELSGQMTKRKSEPRILCFLLVYIKALNLEAVIINGVSKSLNSICLYIYLEPIAFIVFSKMSVTSKSLLLVYQDHIDRIEACVFSLCRLQLMGPSGPYCSLGGEAGQLES